MGWKNWKLKKKVQVFVIITTILFWGKMGWPTPSTTYFTPSTSDVQPYKVWHITADNYSTVGRKLQDRGGDFPTDWGLTVGVLPFKKLQLEVGLDLMEPTDHPLMFNAKLGTPENSLFQGSPALNVGIFNVGFRRDVTDYNIVDFIAGKTLPYLGRVHAGYYIGNSKVLNDKDGDNEHQGFMFGFDRWLVKDKFMLAADYASGENVIGGGGVGLYTFFTPNIDLLIGPVWFNDRGINGRFKWTVQLDINFNLEDFVSLSSKSLSKSLKQSLKQLFSFK